MTLTEGDRTKLMPPPGKRDHIVFDDEAPGLGLRVRANAAGNVTNRSFIFQYRTTLGQKRLTIGQASAVSLKVARDGIVNKKTGEVIALGARQYHSLVGQGKDPAALIAERKVRATETFGRNIEVFIEHQRTKPRKNGSTGLKPRALHEVERHLNTHAKPLHGLQLDSVGRAQVAALLETVTRDSGHGEANRLRGTLSAFFNWALKSGRMTAAANPASFTTKHAEVARDRVLSPAELRSVWHALPEGDYQDCIRLLMLCGQRRDEIGSLHWSEIDGDLIVLPPERVKNGREHAVPLSGPARAIINGRKRNGRALVFGIGSGGFSGWSYCKRQLDKDLPGMKAWTVHDIRRSVATHMGEIGIAPHTIEMVLNHLGHRAGIAGVYNRSKCEAEKREALDKWAARLMEIVG